MNVKVSVDKHHTAMKRMNLNGLQMMGKFSLLLTFILQF